MNKSVKIRNSYALKNELSNFFNKYKKIITVLLFIFIIGLIVGIFTSSKYSGNLELENIPDANLVNFISADKGSFGVFFSYFLRYLILFLFVVFLNFNSFMNFVTYFIIALLGYIFGFTVAGLITLFSLSGIISAVIIIIPFDLCISLLFILITAISIHKFKIYKKFGSSCGNFVNYRNVYFILFLLLIVLLFIKCMLLPILHITIIVN